ncbi:topoisomerase DNA-binding C4 zinc finger domain-containing protein [Xanthomonas campestris]
MGQRIRTAVKAGDACPSCRLGVLQVKHGQHGPFLGCTSYPSCRTTANLR